MPDAACGLSPRQRLDGQPERLAIFDQLAGLLHAVGGHDPDSPLVAGFRAAIRERGAELAALEGDKALPAMLALLTSGEPLAAAQRRAFILTAWAGLPGCPARGNAR